MDWQRIVILDPYMAGHIMAGSYEYWKADAPGPEATAVQCGLQPGDSRYADFLRGWKDCLEEAQIDRLKAEWEKRLKEGEGYTKGDPEVW